MQTLSDSDRRRYEIDYAGQRWIWTARRDGGIHALGLIVAGRDGVVEVPTSVCWSATFREMRSYADFLNTERLARLHAGPRAAALASMPTSRRDEGDDDGLAVA